MPEYFRVALSDFGPLVYAIVAMSFGYLGAFVFIYMFALLGIYTWLLLPGYVTLVGIVARRITRHRGR